MRAATTDDHPEVPGDAILERFGMASALPAATRSRPLELNEVVEGSDCT